MMRKILISDVEELFAQAKAAKQEGLIDITIDYLACIFGMNARHTGALILQGDVYKKQNRNPEALGFYYDALTLADAEKDYETALIAAGKTSKLLIYLGKAEQALPYLDYILLTEPDNPYGLSQKAFAHYKLKQTREGYRTIKKLLELQPENATAWRYKALLLLQYEQPKASLQAINQSLHYNDKEPNTWKTKSIILLLLDRLRDAHTAAKAGLALDPEHIGCKNQCRLVEFDLFNRAQHDSLQLQAS